MYWLKNLQEIKKKKKFFKVFPLKLFEKLFKKFFKKNFKLTKNFEEFHGN